MGKKYIFTSESVTDGHPDKMADQISDSILDACIEQDPESHVACEALLTTDFVLLAGEITTKAQVDYEQIARDTINGIGYDSPEKGFDGHTCEVLVKLHEQSPDIAQGVDKDHEQGAGDQGLMFGYATNETKNLMPLPIDLAHSLTMKLKEVRIDGTLPFLRPDGKSQVSVEYEDGIAKRLENVVIAIQHAEEVEEEKVRAGVKEQVVEPVCGALLDENTSIHINGTGKFVIGGPAADTGLTGRKIIVDGYGGHGSHGGGCFSGKDPSKVDRSATYMARYIAKNIVAAGLADKCEIQLAYCIGVADPMSLLVETFGTGKLSNENLEGVVRKEFPLQPKGIIDHLKLKRPIFKKTATFGHFGREDPDFTWERTDKVDDLKKYLE